MSKKIINHIELFAWIWWFRRAIDLIAKDQKFSSKCLWFSEIDKYATTTYKANYDTKWEIEMWDIQSYVDKLQVNEFWNVDLITWWFPCQSFSMMWNKNWLKDDRGNLFFSIIGLIEKVNPKYILLENVRNLINHDNWKTIKIIKEMLNAAWYYVFANVFNTSNFWLPQHRRRVFIFCVRKDLSDWKIDFSESLVMDHIKDEISKTSIKTYDSVLDWLLSRKVEEKYYLSERIKPTILSNWTKNFKSKSEINQLIARPLTATMVKMHRACQDNYYSDRFLKSKNPVKYVSKKIPKDEEVTHKIRKLTPVEAFRLQWFTDEFCKRARNVWVSDHQLYKQSWNAVSVNTVYSIMKYLIDLSYMKI